ncbi:hypothetical protein [Cesiribacter sp. SM1]|uniref:hypothetical protein n=1 Tax=Cesiribacter sp. SM1 TaxID=2861196 RepID=UPI001CD60903|nr:hypothetical protein [Cesiribacter sp. SM1]
MNADLKPDAYYLERCRELVEEKLGWGSSAAWSQADFQEAAEKILGATGISLSVTTLKRLWGKVNYSGSPSASTLNALALYLGYENWRAFKLQLDAEETSAIPEHHAPVSAAVVEASQPASKLDPSSLKSSRLWVPYLTVLLIVAAGILFYAAKEKEAAPVLTGAIEFNSEPLAKGIPNTVVFNYNLSGQHFDSAFIQQNWDPGRRERISSENRQHTSVYYYPGHFHAKLILNNQVVKEHSLLVPTEGWLGIVEREGYDKPLYILPEQLTDGGALHVSPQLLEAKKVDTSKDYAMVYTNVRDFGVDADNFTFEAAVKNSPEAGGQLCQEVRVLIDGEQGVMAFSLSAPGCVGNLSLNFSDVGVRGKNKDLSAFGADLSEWNKLQCRVKDKHVSLYLNDRQIYTLTYTKPVGRVMGVNLKFHGAGAVDYVRLLDGSEKPVFEDGFAAVVQ